MLRLEENEKLAGFGAETVGKVFGGLGGRFRTGITNFQRGRRMGQAQLEANQKFYNAPDVKGYEVTRNNQTTYVLKNELTKAEKKKLKKGNLPHMPLDAADQKKRYIEKQMADFDANIRNPGQNTNAPTPSTAPKPKGKKKGKKGEEDKSYFGSDAMYRHLGLGAAGVGLVGGGAYLLSRNKNNNDDQS